MFNITLKRSVTTLAVMTGLLAVAGPASAGTPASAQGGGAVVTIGGGKDRGDFTVDMATEKLAAGGGYGDRAIYTVTTYSPKDSPQAGLSPDFGVYASYMTDVIRQDNFVRTVVTDVSWQDTVDWADSNEVAVEGLHFSDGVRTAREAHEGFEIQALGTRAGGEVISSDSY